MVTTLVLRSGRRVRVRASAKRVRERLREPGYIEIGQAKLHRRQVALICVEEEALESARRERLARRRPW
jgi:hypothetical protein